MRDGNSIWSSMVTIDIFIKELLYGKMSHWALCICLKNLFDIIDGQGCFSRLLDKTLAQFKYIDLEYNWIGGFVLDADVKTSDKIHFIRFEFTPKWMRQDLKAWWLRCLTMKDNANCIVFKVQVLNTKQASILLIFITIIIIVFFVTVTSLLGPVNDPVSHWIACQLVEGDNQVGYTQSILLTQQLLGRTTVGNTMLVFHWWGLVGQFATGHQLLPPSESLQHNLLSI